MEGRNPTAELPDIVEETGKGFSRVVAILPQRRAIRVGALENAQNLGAPPSPRAGVDADDMLIHQFGSAAVSVTEKPFANLEALDGSNENINLQIGVQSQE